MSELAVAGGLTNCECCGKAIPVGYMCCPEYLKLKTKVQELEEASATLLEAVMEYVTYKHDGDPYSEDARTMGEMTLNELANNGWLMEFKKLITRTKGE